jgi:hypothetical protein
MPLTTFLGDWELNKPSGDQEIDELLAEARKVTGENYQVVNRYSEERYGFLGHRRRKKATPGLYLEVGGVGPWQVLMCAQNAETVKAYLYGLLNGVEAGRNA